MKRQKTRWMSIAAGVGLLASACTAGGSESSVATVDPSASNAPVTVELTGEWTSKRECTEWQNSFKDGFETTYPWITVDAKCGVTEEQQIAAINAGNPPDVVPVVRRRQRRQVLRHGGVDRPEPVHRRPRRRVRPEHLPGGRADLHELRGHPVLAPVPDGHHGALLQPRPVRAGGPERTAHDDGRADRVRQGAHRVQPRRVDRGGRVRAGHELLLLQLEPAEPRAHVRGVLPR